MKTITLLFKLTLSAALAALQSLAEAAGPDWNVTPNNYEYSMTVTAVLNIDGNIADEAGDKVAAFAGTECRGVASPTVYTGDDGKKRVFLQIYSNTTSGETFTFKLYDAGSDAEMTAINTLAFESDAAIGSVADPYVITTNNNPTSVSLSSVTIMEGKEAGTTVGTFSATDPDGGDPDFTYTLVSGAGGEDNHLFEISGSSLLTRSVFDHDQKTSYSILVEVNDGKGGVFHQQITIEVIPDPYEFSAGSYISPNNDGKNDVWQIQNHEVYRGFKVTIFNDAGSAVFSTTDYQNDWNGTYDGKDLPPGVYFYLVENPGKDKKFTGTITLNR